MFRHETSAPQHRGHTAPPLVPWKAPQPSATLADTDPALVQRVTGRDVASLSRTTARVLQMLLQGDLARLRSESVADALGISPTTLRRRLRADSVCYQELLDRARRHRCEVQLQKRWLPGKSLAWELGYAEVNSFYRAFRRWTGVSYSEFKTRYV